MEETTWKVKGMTCGKCEKHVEEAFASLNGVRKVKADRLTESVRVESDAKLDPAQVREAVEDAGYDLEG